MPKDPGPADAAALVARTTRPRRTPERGATQPPRKVIRRAVTAAAQLAGAKIRRSVGIGSRSKWQESAWSYYDNIGEIHYAAGFYGHCLARVRLVIQKRGADGAWEEVEEAGDPAVQALSSLAGPRGSLTDLQRAYGEQQFVAGESYLLGYRDRTGEGQAASDVVWEMLSGDEVEVKDDTIERKPGGGVNSKTYQRSNGEAELAEGEAIAYRLWDPHPRRSGEADSPMRAVLEPCEELVLMGRAVRSRARNRASGPGILFVHNSITEPDGGTAVGMDEDADQQDPFVSDLIKAISTARTDEESAAASVPYVLRMDPPDGMSIRDAAHLLQLTDPAQAYPETEREVHIIKRIGQGLNLPVEVLTGMADANHWSAWQIDESIWTNHVQAPVERLCADLGNVYVLPTIDGDGDTVRVWYDAAGLVTKPDRFGDALQAHDALALSDGALRDAGGWDDTDAPDEAERRRRVGVRLNDVGLATGGEPTGPSFGSSGDGGSDGPAASPSTTDPGPPEEAAVAGAANAALWRCREAAGARVRTRLQRHPTADRDGFATVENAHLAQAIGRDALLALGLEPMKLVAGGASCLVAAGYPPALAERVERHAAATLFEATPAKLNGHR